MESARARTLRLRLGVALGTVLVLLGCGSDDPQTAPRESAAAATTTTVPATTVPPTTTEVVTATTLPSTTVHATTTVPDTTAPPTTAPSGPPQLYLACGQARFPDDTPDITVLPPIDDAAQAALEEIADIMSTDVAEFTWYDASSSDDELVLLGEATSRGPTDQYGGPAHIVVGFDREGDAFDFNEFSECNIRYSADGYGSTTLALDPDHPLDGNSSELTLLLTENACAGGLPPDGRDVYPVVAETEGAISIIVLVEQVEGDADCVSNPAFPLTLPLRAPLGTRHVADGSLVPPIELGSAQPQFIPDEPTTDTAVVVTPAAVLGWWDGGAWVDSDVTTPDIPVVEGAVFTVVGLDEPQHEAVAGAIDLGCEPSGGYTIALEPPLDFTYDITVGSPLAVNATWPVQPRTATLLDPTLPDHLDAVREQLIALGLPADVPIQLTQVLQVDLDGNGTDEIVITAQHPEFDLNVGPRAGWFSIVMMRRPDGGELLTSLLASDVYVADYDEYPTGTQFGVHAIADLNGDGRMEIAVELLQFEGTGSEIFEVTEGIDPELVLSGGCGA